VSDDDVDMRALATGDRGAFSALFARHSDFVYNVAFRRTADWSAAEDITGLVFLELWRQRTAVVPKGGSIRPWLVSVASNQVKRRWRSASRQAKAYARAAPTSVPVMVPVTGITGR
jgi:RNA polymerase sigma-70 factor (ECF subfamily)